MSLFGLSIMVEQMMRNGKGFAQSVNEINAARRKAGMQPLNADEIEEFANAARKEWDNVKWDKIDKSLGPRPALGTKEDAMYFKKREEIANERVYRSLKAARARFMPSSVGKKAATIADDLSKLGGKATGIGTAEKVGAAGLAALEGLRRRKNEIAAEAAKEATEEVATTAGSKTGKIAKSVGRFGWGLVNPLDLVVGFSKRVPILGAGIVAGVDAYQQSQEDGPWDWARTRDAIGSGGTFGISDRVAEAWEREVPKVNQGDLNPYLTALGAVKEGTVEGVADMLSLGAFDYYTKGPQHSPIFRDTKNLVTEPFKSEETKRQEAIELLKRQGTL